MLKNHLLYLLILTFSYSYSQLEWEALDLSVSNGSQRFDDVFFIDENIGWAANGANAAVYKTIDGGNTWSTQLTQADLGGSYYFRNIEFLNNNIGFLGTLNGEFYKTIDGGNNWTLVTISPNPPAICGLEAIGTTVYGCGAYFEPAHLIKSTDSGVTWTNTDMSAYATALVELLFITETHGYAAGRNNSGGLILETTNGGSTWTEIYNTGVPGEYIWKLNVLPTDNTHIFGAVETPYSGGSPTNGRLIYSHDAGSTWTVKNGPSHIQTVGFVTDNKGWMGGHQSGIFETNDAGDNWTNVGVGGNLNRIHIVNDNLAYASGSTIYKLSDAALSINEYNYARTPLEIVLDKNPIENKLSFTINYPKTDNILIELYDFNGKRVCILKRDIVTTTGEKHYNFDFPYASGTYFINFHNNTGRQALQVVKK